MVLFTRQPVLPSVVERMGSKLRARIPVKFFQRETVRTRHGFETNEVVEMEEVTEPFHWLVFRHEIVRDDEVIVSETLDKDNIRPRLIPKFGRLSWSD